MSRQSGILSAAAERLLARHRAITLLVEEAPASLRTGALLAVLEDQGADLAHLAESRDSTTPLAEDAPHD